jgi:cell division septation protein DedD
MSEPRAPVRIYLCCEADDLAAERELLRDVVLPELFWALAVPGLEVTFWDAAASSSAGAAVGVADLQKRLRQIDDCGPFFVGLLGERCGEAGPVKVSRSLLGAYPWMARQVAAGASSLEIEMEYALSAVLPAGGARRGLLYFRDTAPLAGVPPAARRVYMPAGDDERQRMAALKSILRESRWPVVDGYPWHWDAERQRVGGLQPLARRILRDLAALVAAHLGIPAPHIPGAALPRAAATHRAAADPAAVHSAASDPAAAQSAAPAGRAARATPFGSAGNTATTGTAATVASAAVAFGAAAGAAGAGSATWADTADDAFAANVRQEILSTHDSALGHEAVLGRDQGQTAGGPRFEREEVPRLGAVADSATTTRAAGAGEQTAGGAGEQAEEHGFLLADLAVGEGEEARGGGRQGAGSPRWDSPSLSEDGTGGGSFLPAVPAPMPAGPAGRRGLGARRQSMYRSAAARVEGRWGTIGLGLGMLVLVAVAWASTWRSGAETGGQAAPKGEPVIRSAGARLSADPGDATRCGMSPGEFVASRERSGVGPWVVQVGELGDGTALADRLADLTGRGEQAFLAPVVMGSRSSCAIEIGPYFSRDKARLTAQRMQALGLDARITATR